MAGGRALDAAVRFADVHVTVGRSAAITIDVARLTCLSSRGVRSGAHRDLACAPSKATTGIEPV